METKQRYFNLNRSRDILLSLALLVLILGWTDTLRTDTPAGTDDPREADDRMREIKGAFVERLNIDHYFAASATSTYDATDSGMHRYITFQGPNTTPATIAENQARLYTKDVSSKAELHFIDEDENEIQLTSGGRTAIGHLISAKASSDTLAAGDLGGNYTFTNTGASAVVTITLPAGAVNYKAAFLVTDTDGIRIDNTAEQFHMLGTTTTAGYYIESTTIGSYIEVTWDGTYWTITAVCGGWDEQT